ncbi:MAG: hypothetical protein H7Y32_11120 [Chloroflexales bacterium]|nr:hypothetical protein [Chloroflexales bacterium]
MSRRLLALVFTCVILAMALPLDLAQAATAQRCFTETNLCIKGRLLRFWEQNGGLAVFGLPITSQRKESVEGEELQVQWFERNRLELHERNREPNDVLVGRIGFDRLAQDGRDWTAFPKSDAQPGCRFFAETGHNVCGEMLAAWRANGLELDGKRGTSEAESLALFGLPLSDSQAETLSDGVQYTVQWFERARFELHPANPASSRVLFGLLGRESNPTPSPAPNDDTQDGPKPTPKPGAPPQTTSACSTKNQPKIVDGAQAWMTVPNPARPSTTRLCIRLIVNNQPVAGAPAAAALHYNERVAERGPFSTGADGIASTLIQVSETASTRTVPIDVWVTYKGNTYAAQTSYSPQ